MDREFSNDFSRAPSRVGILSLLIMRRENSFVIFFFGQTYKGVDDMGHIYKKESLLNCLSEISPHDKKTLLVLSFQTTMTQHVVTLCLSIFLHK